MKQVASKAPKSAVLTVEKTVDDLAAMMVEKFVFYLVVRWAGEKAVHWAGCTLGCDDSRVEDCIEGWDDG